MIFISTVRKAFTILLVAAGLTVRAQVPGSAIDVQHYTFALQLNDENNAIKGQATVEVKYLKDATGFSLDLVNRSSNGKGMLVSAITENGKNIKFEQENDQIKIHNIARIGNKRSYVINYEGVPADGLIISTNAYGHRTFFGDNWPNRAHNWLPCVDAPADKAPVDFIITAPDHYQVVSNGLKLEEENKPDHLKLTHWQETVALPTKVMVIGVAEFAIEHTGDVKGIPVYSYVFPENKEAGFKSYLVAKDILPFFISKVGPYAYEKLANVQSKTIFGGMENASAIFYFEESVINPGIEELMAHEIAHQWFGDGASEKSFAHLWLSEGFATYMASLYLENKYGADTLKKRMIATREKVLDFEKRRFTPVIDSAVKSDYKQLLNANSYEKGNWVLHMLRRKLGDAIFWKGVSAYYAKYNGGNANTDDLRRVMEQASGQDLKQFFKQWLRIAGHPDLGIIWKYDAAKNVVDIGIDQKQTYLYELNLQVAIDGQRHSISIKDKTTNAQIPVKAKPQAFVADPDANVLATFKISENK